MLYQKMAKGYVNSENRSLLKEDIFLWQSVVKMMAENGRQVMAGKKLLRDQILAVGAKLQADLDASPSVFWTRRTPAPRTVSKTQTIDLQEAALLTYNRNTKLPMLARSRFTLSPRRVLHELGLAPIEIKSHAFQRMVQRNEGRTDAVKFMLTQAELRMGLLCTMLSPGSAMPEKSLAFPMGDGLLLGSIVSTLYDDPAWDLYEKTDFQRTGLTTQQDVSIGRAVMVYDYDRTAIGFQARTYIGPVEMRDSQKALHAALVGLANEYEAHLQDIANICYFPDDILLLPLDALEATINISTIIQEKVIDLFMDPRFARAMGNSGPPSTRPPSSTNGELQRIKAREEKQIVAKLMTGQAEEPWMPDLG
jgi:hypothetical protein